jgi:transcriptional regulator with XRE-family HTH domain
MTPFGYKLREMRRDKGVTLTEMAGALEVSPAYLSALEHGKRGRPSLVLLHQICGYFNIIWDEAEALQRLAHLSHPRVTVDTAGLSPEATELANLLAERIADLPEESIRRMLEEVKGAGSLSGRATK